MAVSVFLPSTLFGASSSIIGSAPCPLTRLSSAVFIPGAMMQPTSSPFAVITSNVVAVPEVDNDHRPAVFFIRADAVDDNVRTYFPRVVRLYVQPVFTPGPTTIGFMPKKYSHMWQIV